MLQKIQIKVVEGRKNWDKSARAVVDSVLRGEAISQGDIGAYLVGVFACRPLTPDGKHYDQREKGQWKHCLYKEEWEAALQGRDEFAQEQKRLILAGFELIKKEPSHPRRWWHKAVVQPHVRKLLEKLRAEARNVLRNESVGLSARPEDADKKAVSPFRFKPGFRNKPVATTATIVGQQLNVDLRHNEMQQALYWDLTIEYGEANVGAEIPTGTGDRIDLVVRRGAKYWFYEIKTSLSSRDCIREALAQLLEYSFWPGAQKAERLIIVGEPLLDPDSERFLTRLKKDFSLPLEYKQFSPRKV